MTDHRLLYGAPPKTGRDGLDRATGTSAVKLGADIKCIRQAAGVIKAGIIHAVKKVLERPAHVSKILGGTQHQCLRGEHIICVCFKRSSHHKLYALRLSRYGARFNCVAQPLGIVRWHMGHDQQRSGLDHSNIVDATAATGKRQVSQD